MAAILLLIFFVLLPLRAQEWPYFGADAGGTKYSPLKQINRGNVDRLRVAWTYHTGDVSDGKTYVVRSAFEGTPLMVDGVLYLTTPFCRLIALDAETGRELWAFDPKIDRDKSHNLFINRGAAYWTDGKQKRLYYGTLEGYLHAIDATTGRPVESFGRAGKIDLREGIAEPGSRHSMTSPPAIYKNLVICGSLVSDAEPRGANGDARAFDVHTGRMVWQFHVIPREGEAGIETWAAGSASNRGAANAWAPLSVDIDRGMVFLPLTSPATNYYGGDRKGANLFSNALVAVDAATGKRIWHFQISRHDLWDYDLPAQPSLVTVKHGGKLIPAVAQVTKQGFAFVFMMFQFGFLVLWVTLIVMGTFLRGPNWNFFGPYEIWDAHKVEALNNRDLSEFFWVDLMRSSRPRAPEGTGDLAKIGFAIFKESPGILLTIGYFTIVPPLLVVMSKFFQNLFIRMGFLRYMVMTNLLLFMALLPIKMLLRWTVNMKYFISMPEYLLNL